MNLEDIKRILLKEEGVKIEFKKSKNSAPKSLYETVVSFSNTDGGTIVLGADDDGTVIGVDKNSIGQVQTDIVTALNDRSCINPPLYLQPEVIQHTNGVLLVLQIPVSSQVHDHAGKIYIRESDADIDITGQQSKIADLFHRKRTLFSEGEIYDHLNMSDLDENLFNKARTLIRNYKSDHPWLLTDNLQMLKDSILWKKDFVSGKEGFTLAAALIFGKDQTIQSILPAYKVEAMVRIKNKDRWDDRITLRTNLIDTYLQLKEFINKHLPEKFYMEGDQRIDLRDKIFREVIGNVIVHREYTNALSTDLIITENEVTFTNPNKPLFHGPLDPSSFNPFAKNPNIRKFFTAFGWTDEIGSGIRNTFRYLPYYVPGAKPLFIENDTFKTDIPLVFVTLADHAVQLFRWLDLPVLNEEELKQELNNIPLPSSLADKHWEEIILHLVPSWQLNGTQYPALKWPDKQIFTEKIKDLVPSKTKKVPSEKEKGTKLNGEDLIENQQIMRDEIKKVSSWHEKGTKLLSRKSIFLISLLTLTSKPAKREELMEILNYENRKTFNDLYLKPLLQVGFIRRTNEENPRASNQQYFLTETGKHFLGGTLS
jgi:ATP-dependent DNA helicase RecG